MNKKRLPKKNKRKSRGKNMLTNNTRNSNPNTLQSLSSVRSNPSDQFITLTLPFKQAKISLSSSSTFTYSLEVDAITDLFASGFYSGLYGMFQSWRPIHIAFNLIPLSSTGGSSTFFFTDVAIAPATNYPTFRRRNLPNTNARGQTYWINWRPADFASLDFLDTNSTSSAPIFCFYGFTDNTTFGTPSSTTDLWLISGNITLQFRGLGLQ